MTNQIEQLFKRLNDWRHLPNYQLERRADIFFTLYLIEVCENKFKKKFKQQIIPEFPLHLKTLWPERYDKTDKSVKVDYVVFPEDESEAYFIELKTDPASIREGQNDYLTQAKEVKFQALLKGLKQIFKATAAKTKYFFLFKLLEEASIVKLPDELETVVYSGNMRGINSLISEIKIVSKIDEIKTCYIKPDRKPDPIADFCIGFKEFSEFIKNKHDDPLSQIFAETLIEWNKKAGDKYKP